MLPSGGDEIIKYKCWYLYILRCCDNSLYTGITLDIHKRMQAHKIGHGSKYVRSRLPFTLVAWWLFKASKSDISRIERKVKSLPGPQKRLLVKDPSLLFYYCGSPGESTILLGRKI